MHYTLVHASPTFSPLFPFCSLSSHTTRMYNGSIPISRLSGGVKTLIQIAHDPEHVYNASACGDNCAAWLLRIGKEKDVLVRLGHQMRFTEEPFDIRIENTGQVVHTRKELVTAVISQGLLEETL